SLCAVPSSDFFGNLRERVVLQVPGVAVEFTNALGQLFRRHRVFVVHPAEGLFVQVQTLFLRRRRFGWIELPIDAAVGFLQLVQKLRTNGEQIATREPDNLICIPETCSHHLGLVTIFLVVVVDARDGGDSRILVGRNFRAAVLLLVPIVDAADERRNQSHSRFSARYSLGEAEEQRQVAVDAFLLQEFSRPNAFPCARNLDQDPFPRHALLFVERDELAPLGNRSGGIEAQAGRDLRRDAARDYLENFGPEQDEKLVDELRRHLFVTATPPQGQLRSLPDQV